MKTLRLLACVLLLTAWTANKGHAAQAQADKRPIHLHIGDADSKRFDWTDNPESATVYVFRERVSAGETGGRILADSPTTTRQELQRLGPRLWDVTALTPGPHPAYTTSTLQTGRQYAAQSDGTTWRYLVLVEAGDELFASRAGAQGNYLRYHTLDEPAEVRVAEVHRDWRGAARDLVSGLTRSDASRPENEDSQSLSQSSEDDSGGRESSTLADSNKNSGGQIARDATTSASPNQLLGAHWSWWGGSGLFGALMFVLGMVTSGASSGKEEPSNPGPRSSRKEGHPSMRKDALRSKDREEAKIKSIVERRVEEEVEKRWEKVRRGLQEQHEDIVIPLQERLAELEAEVERLQEKVEDEATQPETAHEEEEPRETVESEVADAFVSWCQTAGGKVRKLQGFERYLSEQSKGAEVKEIQYEKDSTSDEFVESARNAVTYWLVTKNGEQFVFPRPTNQKRFGKLRPVYEGDAMPQSITGIQPARLERQGGLLVLARAGEVW